MQPAAEVTRNGPLPGEPGEVSQPGQPRLAPERLFRDGVEGAEVDSYRDRVRALIEREVSPLVPYAEETRQFPRRAVSAFGASGLFEERWRGGGHGDLGRATILAEEMGWTGLGGVGLGISLHFEAAVGLLLRFARNAHLGELCRKALAGEVVCCVATSERTAGSDLSAVQTSLVRDDGGWRVHGTKWFVSPGAAADVALVLCRAPDGPHSGLAVVAVPRDGMRVLKILPTLGLRGVGTARITVDCRVPDEAVLIRPGFGLPALTWGLLHERLAGAAQLLGGARLALTLAASHLRRRHQFGAPLFDHQALRLRLADLAAQVSLTRRGLYATVVSVESGGDATLRDIAGAKAVAARLAERVISESLQFFGGQGYLEDETPLARLWRDSRIGRIGGGTDEMMLEIVAGGLHGSDDLYATWVGE